MEPADDPAGADVRDPQEELMREFSIADAEVSLHRWEDPELAPAALRCVRFYATSASDMQQRFDDLAHLRGLVPTVRANGEGYVSLLLSCPLEQSTGHEPWVSFDLTPDNAVALASVLTSWAAYSRHLDAPNAESAYAEQALPR